MIKTHAEIGVTEEELFCARDPNNGKKMHGGYTYRIPILVLKTSSAILIGKVHGCHGSHGCNKYIAVAAPMSATCVPRNPKLTTNQTSERSAPLVCVKLGHWC